MPCGRTGVYFAVQIIGGDTVEESIQARGWPPHWLYCQALFLGCHVDQRIGLQAKLPRQGLRYANGEAIAPFLDASLHRLLFKYLHMYSVGPALLRQCEVHCRNSPMRLVRPGVVG